MQGANATTSMVRSAAFWWAFAFFAVLYLIWAGVGVEQVVFAATAAAVAAFVRFNTLDRRRRWVRVWGLVRFVPYFLGVSVRGGLDVARRVFSPSMPLNPGFVDYRLRIDPATSAAVLFGATISLVPGTLCVDIGDGEHVRVHLVDLDAGFEQELERLEQRVAAVFGESI